MARPFPSASPAGFPPPYPDQKAPHSPRHPARGFVPVGLDVAPETGSGPYRGEARGGGRPFARALRRLWRRGGSSAPASHEAAVVAQAPTAQDLLPTLLAGLALRDLSLVEPLLRLVEERERREEDPEELEFLFRIDHLATRTRRNGENLLVLAGQDTGQQRFEPVPLLDVVRAAASEIAQFNRVQIASLPDAGVAGLAADDISHLLAELMDNATANSPQQAQVVVSGRFMADGVVVAVEDSGIGIPADRLLEFNARLANPPVLDVAVTRHMGLYVVGRLAHRHRIRVQLQARPGGGTIAYVVVPNLLVHSAPAAHAPQESAQPRPAAQPPGRVPGAGARTRAAHHRERPAEAHPGGDHGPRPRLFSCPRHRPAAPESRSRHRRSDDGRAYPQRVERLRDRAARSPAQCPRCRGIRWRRRVESVGGRQRSGAVMSPMSSEAQKLSWLVNDFVASVPGVSHAVVVSADGLLLTVSDSLPREKAEQLAAVASGLLSLAQGGSRLLDQGSCLQTIVTMERGYLFVMGISDGSCLTVVASADCDMKIVAYQMTLLVENAGHVLTPRRRAELRGAVNP